MRRLRRLLLALLLVCLAGTGSAADTPPAQARQLHAPETALRKAGLLGVRALPGTELALILLAADGRQLPMFTGLTEAAAILRAGSGDQPPRPQTHELLLATLQLAGLQPKRLVVDRLDDEGNFHAALELVDAGGKLTWMDCRPSDGIALALRAGATLWVAQDVLEQGAGDDPAGPPPLRT